MGGCEGCTLRAGIGWGQRVPPPCPHRGPLLGQDLGRHHPGQGSTSLEVPRSSDQQGSGATWFTPGSGWAEGAAAHWRGDLGWRMGAELVCVPPPPQWAAGLDQHRGSGSHVPRSAAIWGLTVVGESWAGLVDRSREGLPVRPFHPRPLPPLFQIQNLGHSTPGHLCMPGTGGTWGGAQGKAGWGKGQP